VLTSILYGLLIFCSIILIFLVLIQRGKGGGLAGAFGGMGGSSAFGAKAGDVFTKVTMWVAGVWILISMFLVILVNRGHSSAWGPGGTSPTQKVSTTGEGSKKPATEAAASKLLEAEPASSQSTPPPATPPPPSQPANSGDPLAPLPDSKPR
jgi:preprotein translocase subunit SecG